MHARSKNINLHTKVLALQALSGGKQEREEFCIFDKDGDGYICETELRNLLWNMDFNPSEGEMSKILSEAVIDGDGAISRSELIEGVRKLADFGNNVSIQDSICAFDKNKNAFISVADLRGSKNGFDKQTIDNTSKEDVHKSSQEKQLLSLSGNSNTNTREYEAFVTILMQAKPSTQKGCKRQLYNSEGDSEIEKWRKRWRRNAAMRKASVIFPKTWWILMAKITLQRIRDEDTIDLNVLVYYWLTE